MMNDFEQMLLLLFHPLNARAIRFLKDLNHLLILINHQPLVGMKTHRSNQNDHDFLNLQELLYNIQLAF